MRGWLRGNPKQVNKLADRVFEGMREIGILLIAFAPLDVTVTPANGREPGAVVLLFAGFGLFLFVGALSLEWRHDR